ncbi:glutamyl-tRNA reductase [Striga asiatica]|uniref:Glutamyl-tRNA reductase n=1 Tax=Striga asiatica TaxID=4170 RepID=A0A5A7PD87_STRAF|nr:glutamyl-tRNA reductase [Striga asiatica]
MNPKAAQRLFTLPRGKPRAGESREERGISSLSRVDFTQQEPGQVISGLRSLKRAPVRFESSSIGRIYMLRRDLTDGSVLVIGSAEMRSIGSTGSRTDVEPSKGSSKIGKRIAPHAQPRQTHNLHSTGSIQARFFLFCCELFSIGQESTGLTLGEVTISHHAWGLICLRDFASSRSQSQEFGTALTRTSRTNSRDGKWHEGIPKEADLIQTYGSLFLDKKENYAYLFSFKSQKKKKAQILRIPLPKTANNSGPPPNSSCFKQFRLVPEFGPVVDEKSTTRSPLTSSAPPVRRPPQLGLPSSLSATFGFTRSLLLHLRPIARGPDQRLLCSEYC